MPARTETCSSQRMCSDFLDNVSRLVDGLRQRDDHTPAEGAYCNMPATCGPTAWAVLHGVAEALRDDVCVHCGEEAVRLMRGLHDAVNMKLNKPVMYPADLAFLRELVSKEPEVAMAQCSGKNMRMYKACASDNPEARALCAASLGCAA